MLHSLYLGSSIAISWAWGTSLILGMQIAQTKGIDAFGIWASANCFTLVLFGWLYRKGFIFEEVLNKPVVKIFTNLIQIFCLIIQLKILNETLLNFVSPISAYLLSAGMGISLTLLMYYRGLAESIRTDLFQGILTITTLCVMAYLCMDKASLPIVRSTTPDITWGLWSACILLSGIMTGIQHWQRADVAGKSHAFTVAGILFAIYMLLVLAMSFFEFNWIMNILLILAVIGVTTSTIYSIAIFLHEISNRTIGTAVALFVCVFWEVFASIGITDLWSKAGAFRVAFALSIISLAFYYHKKHLIKI